MQRDPNNCRERVCLAVESLVGEDDLSQRVHDAYQQLLPLQTKEFPPDLQSEFEVIMASMRGSSHDPGGLGDKVAIRVVRLLDRLSRSA